VNPLDRVEPSSGAPKIRELTREIVSAPDAQIKRIVAQVDAMTLRGPADSLIEPLRQRLRVLRPPRPLRFVRLMFSPLDPLIVPASRWLPGRHAIPRSALLPMALMVHHEMGDAALEIEAEGADRTTADSALMERLGRSLWPVAARILREPKIPDTWEKSGLGDMVYRPLADTVAALLGQAVPLDVLCAETANGRLSPSPERLGVLLDHIVATRPEDLPMLIALLLARAPASVASILTLRTGLMAKTIEAALDQAADRVLSQLAQDEGTEVLIASGTLEGAGAMAARTAILLEQLGLGSRKPQRREQLQALRRRLDDSCKARFTLGLQEELLTPLQTLCSSPDSRAIQDLETAARGLRTLGLEARVVGSGATYDLLLRKAAETVKDSAMRDRLTHVDQIRLVEVLAGPDAALELLGVPQGQARPR
jgi:hypothetical protein